MDYGKDDYKIFYDIESFFNEFINKLEQSSIIYFHNLSFDGDFIIKYLFNHTNKKLTRKLKYREGGWEFFRGGNQIYCIKYGHWVTAHKYVLVEFRCSLKLLSASVNQLGATFNMNKYKNNQDADLEKFYNREPLDPNNLSAVDFEYIDYCINDCLIVKTALTYFFKEIEGLKLYYSKNKNYPIRGDLRLTAGSLAIAMIKSMNDFRWKNIKTSHYEYDIGMLFYRGGFTQFNPDFQNKKVKVNNGIGIDINSSFPFQMTKNLPLAGTLDVFSCNDLSKLIKIFNNPKNSKNLYYVEIEVSKVTALYDKCYFLPKFDNPTLNRYLNGYTNYHGFFMLNELITLMKFYNFENVKIIKCWTCKSDNWLKKYIHLIYAYKEKYSKEKNASLALTYKILLNSSYGKFATREVFEYEWHTDQVYEIGEYLEFDNKMYEVKRISKIRQIGDKDICIILEPLERNKRLYSKIVAATITAYARIQLLETIHTLDPINFIYCDTDSIYLQNADVSKIKCDDYELGAWKIEKTFTEMYVKGAKAYICGNDEKIISAKYSGINSGYLKRNLDYSLFMNEEALENSNITTIRVKSGIILVPKTYIPKPRKI